MRGFVTLTVLPLIGAVMLVPVSQAAQARPSAALAASATWGSTDSLQSGWGNALGDANITKTNLNAADYQYPLIANGGFAMMPGPTGFPDVKPPGAPYAPVLTYDKWWSNNTARTTPFKLSGGYLEGDTLEPNAINEFKQELDVATGTLTSALRLMPAPPPAPAPSLEDSRWIWFPAGDAGGGDMPAGDAYFLNTFDIPEGSTVVGAGAELTSDDQFTLYINGTKVSSGTDWQAPQAANVFNQVRPGTNTVAIRAHNVTGPAGVIGDIRVKLSDGTTVTLLTDASWGTSLTAPDGWQNPGFDSSSWSPVLDEAAYGEGPWGTRLGEPTAVPPVPVPDAPDEFRSTRTSFVTSGGVIVIQMRDSVTHRVAVRIGPEPGFGIAYEAASTGISAVSSGNGTDPMGLAASASGSQVKVDADSGTVSAVVGPDQPVTFYVAAAGLDDNDPGRTANSRSLDTAESGFSRAEKENEYFWKKFWGASSVSLPDDDLMTWYVRNQYYLGAFMANGHVPQGVDGPRSGPAQYLGNADLEYDAVYNFLALLTANQPAIAQVTADWVEKILPEAEKLAPYYTYDGKSSPGAAAYPWLADYHGIETKQFGPPPVENDWQAYPSANAALIDILQAQYTNDPDRLKRAEEILVKVTKHQLDNSAREPTLDNQWVSQKFRWYYGPANGFVKGAVPDQSALKWSLKQASTMGVGPDEWRDWAEQVYLPTGMDEARGQKAIAGYLGATPSMANSMFVYLLPLYFYGIIDAKDPLTAPTVANEIGSPDLYDSLIRGNAAVGAAAAGSGDQSLALLKYMLNSTNAANRDTAILWDDTYFAEGANCGFCTSGPSGTPRLAGHSTMNQAMQRMLLDGASPSRISVFPAMPSDWNETGASFDDLLANGGIEVSARYDDSGTSVTLKNTSSKSVTRTVSARLPTDTQRVSVTGVPDGKVDVDGQFAEFTQTIPAGATREVTLTPSKTGTWRTLDDTSPSIAFTDTPDWSATDTADGWLGETAHYTNNAGASAEMTFTGTAIEVIGDRAPDHGQFKVYVDGRLEGFYDAWRDRPVNRQVIFARYGLSAGTHTIRIEATSIKDSQASSNYLGVDAIRFLS